MCPHALLSQARSHIVRLHLSHSHLVPAPVFWRFQVAVRFQKVDHRVIILREMRGAMQEQEVFLVWQVWTFNNYIVAQISRDMSK